MNSLNAWESVTFCLGVAMLVFIWGQSYALNRAYIYQKVIQIQI